MGENGGVMPRVKERREIVFAHEAMASPCSPPSAGIVEVPRAMKDERTGHRGCLTAGSGSRSKSGRKPARDLVTTGLGVAMVDTPMTWLARLDMRLCKAVEAGYLSVYILP